MAEILGVGISVASLASQVADSLNKVITFCDSIHEAPADIHWLVCELHTLTDIISIIQNMIETNEIPETLEPTLQSALKRIMHDSATLSILCSELDRKLKSERKFVRTWARMQTVFSEKKLALLKFRLEGGKGGLQLLQSCIIIEIDNLESLARQTPKALGHYWERGGLDSHLTVDDGLGEPLVVPLEICSSPQDIVSLLGLKYKSRTLPGLSQIRQGHIAIFDWSQNFKVDAKNWELVVKPGGRVKIAFLMSTWYGLL
ncbi:hypothetical protein BKA65DRAFT_143503 [Rhexocercosporidium sp. MPI-PUGE-AT-0058]|nr:hypothetical protein BKA65DRAFT_143503 [Rhexocercosporidium sp. MPI-PUGE-AT-0058]